MGYFKKILNLIILTILIVIFVLYNLMTYFNKDIEGFQSENTDIKTNFFDLSANYLKMDEDDKFKPVPAADDEEPILNIGGSFGDFDASRIPWDAENKELLPREALYGIVPTQASTALFSKVIMANQLGNINSLVIDTDTNKVMAQSPVFNEPEDTEKQDSAAEIGGMVGVMVGTMIYSEFLEESDEIMQANNKISKMPPDELAKIDDEIAQLEELDKADNAAGKAGQNADKIKELKKTKTPKGLGSALGNALKAPINLVGMITGGVFKLLNFLSGGILQKASAKIVGGVTSAVTAINPKAIGKIADSMKGAMTSLKNLKGSAKKALNEIGSGVAKKLSKEINETIAKQLAKKIAVKIATMLYKSMLLSVSLKGINPTLGIIYDIVVTPIVLVFALSGVVDGALEKIADPEGCCPVGTTPLDDLIPQLLNDILIANIPIIGDVLGFFFPYVCSDNRTSQLTYKLRLTLPKFIEYPHLTTYFLNWPDYNCRVEGTPPVYGKKLLNGGNYSYASTNPSSYDWNNGTANPLSFHTDFNDIISDQFRFKQIMRVKTFGKIDDSKVESILPQGKKLFYADFTEPQMLIDMAQYYYNWAITDPYPNDDGTVTVEYISKINYVIASSLYTCDVMCEMISATYDPLTGINYKETVTYDRDRRFYYRANNVSNAPRFWEDIRNAEFRSLSDSYDLRVNDLNIYIHQDGNRNTELEAGVLIAAYRQVLDASNRFEFIREIATANQAKTGVTGTYDLAILEFNRAHETAKSNLSNVIRKGLALSANNNIDVIKGYLSNIIVSSNALWEYHKNLPASQPGTYSNNQYKILGCTKIDSTASSAFNPDVTYFESESRYCTNYNVLPYIKRCKTANIDMGTCINSGNLEKVIYSYYLNNPTVRIKNINNVKPKGRNACEFKWDEVTYNATTKTETDLRKNVVTTILYQQDLSSCSFNLPPPTPISGTSNYLFGTQTGGATTIQEPPTSLKMFTNPVNSSDVNYDAYITLQYKKAEARFPVMPTEAQKALLSPNQHNTPLGVLYSNVDYVPRYDLTDFTLMRPLVRPKKPIRIRYPNEDQKELGGYSNEYCSDPATLSNFILNYNGNSNNSNKIAKIIRTYTSSSNTCDLEVDMYYTNLKKMKRVTLTANMIEKFQNEFTYDSLNTEGSGLNVDVSTEALNQPFSNGFGYSRPYLNTFQEEILPNTVYFNDNLIKNFTGKTKDIRNNTYRILQGVVGTQTLGGSNCSAKCSDDEIIQRIIEQYDRDGVPKNRYDAEKNSVRQVLNAGTSSINSCHVIIDNRNDYYADYYDTKNSSNNKTEFRLKFKKVLMKDAGNCKFYPVQNQTYQDISASDIALTSSPNFPVYKKRIRNECVPIDCRSPLMRQAFNDYKVKTGNTVKNLLKSMNINDNVCDYLIETKIRKKNNSFLDEEERVLRVTYNNTLYSNSMSSNCSVNNTYSYTPDNFLLQIEASSNTFRNFRNNINSNSIKYYYPIYTNSNAADDPNSSPLPTDEDYRIEGKVDRNTSNINLL